jgi:hypothetical protein
MERKKKRNHKSRDWKLGNIKNKIITSHTDE